MTEFRNAEEIGGIVFKNTGAIGESAKMIACSKVGVVFCSNESEGLKRTLRWDFTKRATIGEVAALQKKEESKNRGKYQ